MLSMENKVNYTIVGAFVIILTAALVFGIIWLSSGLTLQHYQTYAVYMQESVSGLSVNANVEYNGVGVGKVKSIELYKKNPHLVIVLLDIKTNTPITRGTVATLTTRGITGLVFIALKDSGYDQEPLKAEKGEPYPVIATAPSIFVRLDTVLTQFSTNFRQITASLQSLLDKENLASIKQTLHSLQVITNAVAMNDKKIQAILRNTATASDSFSPFMKNLEVDTLPSASRMFTNFDETANSFSELSSEIKQNPSILIRGVDLQNLGPGETK